jgi:MoxR-like ATPase
MEITEKSGNTGNTSNAAGHVQSEQAPMGHALSVRVPSEHSPLELLNTARNEMAKRIVGQNEMIDGLLTALIAGGHILLEGVPGLAKTRAVKTLAEITGLVFKRIQFTPDLLPADLTGTLVWEQATSSFSVRRGPVFANVILADEINRAPAKVQSALLEAMEEQQVTIGEKSYSLPSPFFVLATQNPIEHEGTYALPEAELDRFLLKLLVPYPDPEEELCILDFAVPFGKKETAKKSSKNNIDGVTDVTLTPVLGPGALEILRKAADSIFTDEQILRYIVSVVAASRPAVSRSTADGVRSGRQREGLYRYIAFGASPRASLALYRCSRIRAFFAGRSFVTPEDVKAAAFPVLRHRLVLSYEAEADGLDSDTVISRILTLVPMP